VASGECEWRGGTGREGTSRWWLGGTRRPGAFREACPEVPLHLAVDGVELTSGRDIGFYQDDYDDS